MPKRLEIGVVTSDKGTKTRRVEIPELQVSVAFPRVVRVDLARDFTVTLLIGLASEVLQILRERNLNVLREWSSNPRVFRSDGLLVRAVVDDDRPDSIARFMSPPSGLGQGRLVEGSRDLAFDL